MRAPRPGPRRRPAGQQRRVHGDGRAAGQRGRGVGRRRADPRRPRPVGPPHHDLDGRASCPASGALADAAAAGQPRRRRCTPPTTSCATSSCRSTGATRSTTLIDACADYLAANGPAAQLRVGDDRRRQRPRPRRRRAGRAVPAAAPGRPRQPDPAQPDARAGRRRARRRRGCTSSATGSRRSASTPRCAATAAPTSTPPAASSRPGNPVTRCAATLSSRRVEPAPYGYGLTAARRRGAPRSAGAACPGVAGVADVADDLALRRPADSTLEAVEVGVVVAVAVVAATATRRCRRGAFCLNCTMPDTTADERRARSARACRRPGGERPPERGAPHVSPYAEPQHRADDAAAWRRRRRRSRRRSPWRRCRVPAAAGEPSDATRRRGRGRRRRRRSRCCGLLVRACGCNACWRLRRRSAAAASAAACCCARRTPLRRRALLALLLLALALLLGAAGPRGSGGRARPRAAAPRPPAAARPRPRPAAWSCSKRSCCSSSSAWLSSTSSLVRLELASGPRRSRRSSSADGLGGDVDEHVGLQLVAGLAVVGQDGMPVDPAGHEAVDGDCSTCARRASTSTLQLASSAVEPAGLVARGPRARTRPRRIAPRPGWPGRGPRRSRPAACSAASSSVWAPAPTQRPTIAEEHGDAASAPKRGVRPRVTGGQGSRCCSSMTIHRRCGLSDRDRR